MNGITLKISQPDSFTVAVKHCSTVPRGSEVYSTVYWRQIFKYPAVNAFSLAWFEAVRSEEY